MNLSIVLPCYNEAATLEKLFHEYAEAVADLRDVELIPVNNGSTDETQQVLDQLEVKIWPFKLTRVRVEVNQGYGNGIKAGLEAASGAYLAWSHADRQCPARDVVNLYHAVLHSPNPEGTFGKGYRINDRDGAEIFTRLQTFFAWLILGEKMVETNAQPKLFHRSFLRYLAEAPQGYEFDFYAFYRALKKKYDIVTVDVHFLEREHGVSTWAHSLPSRLRFIARSFIYLLRLRLQEAARQDSRD
jgi:glycosyltransferase involved in cell wall biosynthesis